MKERILAIQEEGKAELALVQDAVTLQAWEIKYLGRKSELNSLLKGLKDLSPEEKRVVGPLANATRQELSQAFA
mgnify:FL=1